MPRIMSRFLCFREIKKLFRILEIFLIIVFLSWVAARVSLAVRISGEIFRQLVNFVVTPLFIFLLGNLIALTLFFKSRHLFRPQAEPEPESVFEFIENGPYYFPGEINSLTPQQAEEKKEVEFQDKQTIFEVSKVIKVQKRSQSENFTRSAEKKSCSCHRKQLRRSETEKPRRTEAAAAAAAAEDEEIVDDLSNEEFKRAIEDFIAKQVQFHQQEKLAIVLHANATTT